MRLVTTDGRELREGEIVAFGRRGEDHYISLIQPKRRRVFIVADKGDAAPFLASETAIGARWQA